MAETKQRSVPRKVGSHVRNRVATGLFLMVPIVITYLILRFAINFLDGLVRPGTAVLARWFGDGEWLNYVPAIASTLIVLILLYLIGLFAQNFIGKRVIRAIERFSQRIPVVREIYATANDAISLFSGGGPSKQFSRVVLVPFPNKDAKSLGFVTGTYNGAPGGPYLMVYIPTTPTPMSGFLIFVKETNIEDAGMTVDVAIRTIITGGLTRSKKPGDPA